MNTGILWFDNDPKVDLVTKIQRAADYYQKKYSKPPTLVLVHPSMLPKELLDKPELKMPCKGIVVRKNRSVLPNHFWVGETEEEEPDVVTVNLGPEEEKP